MVQRRISFKDLARGAPLRWNLFSGKGGGKPVLHKGELVPDLPQLATLLDQGLFADEEAPSSVLQWLNQSNRRLERLLHDLRNEDNAEAELRHIARDVIQAVELDADIALACIFLSQIAGTYAVRHCIETAVVAVIVARGMDKSTADTVTVTAAALTMNVGMLRHHETFQKHSALTREEQAIVRRHPEDSADLLKSAGIEDEEWISCVLLHHENDDGSGYPAGIASPQVTQNAKLISLADRYCAQVSARNYRCSVLPDRALRTLLDHDGVVDTELAQLFRRELGHYPPGSLVRLNNGEVAVVTQRAAKGGATTNAAPAHAPSQAVHSLRDSTGAPLQPGASRDTSHDSYAIAEALTEDQAGVRFSMKQIWGELASL
jgi:HD-GYP domain-containing protein (c-di-GMP phosphodiesterase class II)